MLIRRLPGRRLKFLIKIFVACAIFLFAIAFFKNQKRDTFGKNLIPESLFFKSMNELSAEEKIYEEQIRQDEAIVVPGLGDLGVAVELQGEEKERGDEALKTISLNEVLSKKLSLNRTLKDYRHPDCAKVTYDAVLPSASIVVVFHNEPYSVILRTVWSVLKTASPYIHDVVLVDDNSTVPELEGKLDWYLHTRLPEKVKIVRLRQRSGLIRARLAGARAARGDVLVFLDAHCECVEDWLRPLLQRIKEERKAALVPIIDVIDSKTFYYSSNGYSFQVGGFIFSGHFTWINLSDKEVKRRASEIAPARSPTMAGGLFAMERSFFWEVGSYDEQMDGWGGENLEMSFRIWQCGGILETIPCSRVGHIFRDFHPYKFPNDKDTHGINTARLALVWMDEYADLFFSHRKDLENRNDIGDITHRKVLREKLHCRSFDWYLSNVFPEKFVPKRNLTGYGRFKNPHSNLCIDMMGRDTSSSLHGLGIYSCHPRLHLSQHLSLTKTGELRTEELCAQVQYKRHNDHISPVLMEECHSKKKDQEWYLTDFNQIKHVQSNDCLDTYGLASGDDLHTNLCDTNSPTQRWHMEFNERNQFGNLPSSFNEDNEDFGKYGDENRPLATSNERPMRKRRKQHPAVSYSINNNNVLAKPQGFPGKFRVPAYRGLHDNIR